MSFEKIRKIKQLSGFKSQTIHDLMERRLAARMATGQADFQAMMNRVDHRTDVDMKVDVDKKIGSEKQGRPTLMDAVSDHHKKLAQSIDGRASVHQLVDNSKDVAQVVAQLREQLDDPSVELKRSTQRLLQEKLTNINENLQVALSKVGLEHALPPDGGRLIEGVRKFIGMLSYSQRSLEMLGQRVSMLSTEGNISPATMLTVQVKMHTVVQELEFFTSLLSKSVESIKTVMNVQV